MNTSSGIRNSLAGGNALRIEGVHQPLVERRKADKRLMHRLRRQSPPIPKTHGRFEHAFRQRKLRFAP